MNGEDAGGVCVCMRACVHVCVCVPMLTAALFTIAKTCQWMSINRGTNGEDAGCVCVHVRVYMCVCVHVCAHVDTHSGVLLSPKKEQNNAIHSNMNGPRDDRPK